MPCYGIPPLALADPKACTVPVQAHFGADDGMDGFSSKADAEALRATLAGTPCGSESEVHIYEGAGHAFLNATDAGIARKAALGQGEHNDAAITLAWSRIMPFLHKHLKQAV